MSADLQNVVFPGLKDRVVIVTGAGQGIGRVFAKAFAAAGARAVIAELNEKKAAAVSEEIMKAGGQALAVTTDVADEASIKEMVELVEGEYGRIDVLINNAGIFSTLEMRPFDQIPAGRVGARAARQPHRSVSLRARGAPGHAAREMGPHHQCRIRRRASWPAELSALHRNQGGAYRA